MYLYGDSMNGQTLTEGIMHLFRMMDSILMDTVISPDEFKNHKIPNSFANFDKWRNVI